MKQTLNTNESANPSFNFHLLKSISLIVSLPLVMMFLFSCTPKKASVRAQVKNQQTNLNPTGSAQAEQQGQSLNAVYKVMTVSLPQITDNLITVDSAIQNPSNSYIPVTTKHSNGQLDAQGEYQDSARGLTVYFNSRCSDTVCSKYLLLVTAVRNNQKVFQSGVISFKDDCKFYSVSNSTNTSGQMFNSIADFETQYGNILPMNDGGNCPQ